MPSCNKKTQSLPGLIPKPVSINYTSEALNTGNHVNMVFEKDDKKIQQIANIFLSELSRFNIYQKKENKKYFKINLLINENAANQSPESYTLKIDNNEINLKSIDHAGIFYGLQTLLQILQSNKLNNVTSIPGVLIHDFPRFKWRGMHLDVGRHMFSIDFIKRYIDIIAEHKMNIFHWHLTEDQGWRMPIEQYPKLESIAAYRKETLIGHYSDRPHKFDGKRYGGSYTKEEILEVIQYAQERFITVVPEIEMPGHATAALSAYPELSCSGGPHEPETIWGIHNEVFCAGNEKTFEFLENVLSEVSQIFPSPYIHIGGDECPKTRWEECEKCQKRISNEKLKDEHELQSYFIKRIEKILEKFDKRLIGWDEILEGGLAPNAIVHSWRGMKGGIKAANAGHEVIMSPTTYVYFDYYQSKKKDDEPIAIGGYLPISKVYEFEPVPDNIDKDKRRLILGGQANLWTEYISTDQYAEYMLLPRMCALSEVLWTPKNKKNYDQFYTNLIDHLNRLDTKDYNYRKLEK